MRGVQREFCTNCEKKCPQMYRLSFRHVIACFETGLVKNYYTIYIYKEKLDPLLDLDGSRDSARSSEDESQRTVEQIQAKNQQLYEPDPGFEQQRQLIGKDHSRVPLLLKKVWGPISHFKYQLLKQNESWLKRSVQVCESCYLLFTQHSFKTQFQIKVEKNLQERQIRQEQQQIYNSIDMFQMQNTPNAQNEEQISSYLCYNRYSQSRKLQAKTDQDISSAYQDKLSTNIQYTSTQASNHPQVQSRQSDFRGEETVAVKRSSTSQNLHRLVRQPLPKKMMSMCNFTVHSRSQSNLPRPQSDQNSTQLPFAQGRHYTSSELDAAARDRQKTEERRNRNPLEKIYSQHFNLKLPKYLSQRIHCSLSTEQSERARKEAG